MDDAEVCLVLQFLGLKELGVSALLLQHLLHKALVRGFGEPALLIQQGEDPGGAGLSAKEREQTVRHQIETL